MARILIADDDPHIREVVCFALEKAGHQVTARGDGRSALEAAFGTQPDLDGIEVCRRIREKSAVPILFLSAKDEEIDKIIGLEVGGDDYITKPFSKRELVARVKAMLRRVELSQKPSEESSEVKKHGELTLDPDRFEVGRHQVADRALCEVELSMQQSRGRGVLRLPLDARREVEQVAVLRRELGGRRAVSRRAGDETAVAGESLENLPQSLPLRFVGDAPGDPDLPNARKVDESASRQRQVRRHARALSRERILRDLDDDLLPLLQEVVDARAVRAKLALGVRAGVLRIEIRGARQNVLDVEKRVPLEADRDERRLHPGQHAMNAPEIDVADEPLSLLSFVQNLHGPSVLEQSDPRLGRGRVDEEVFPHAFANRRYSTARISPMPRNAVATDDPP